MARATTIQGAERSPNLDEARTALAAAEADYEAARSRIAAGDASVTSVMLIEATADVDRARIVLEAAERAAEDAERKRVAAELAELRAALARHRTTGLSDLQSAYEALVSVLGTFDAALSTWEEGREALVRRAGGAGIKDEAEAMPSIARKDWAVVALDEARGKLPRSPMKSYSVGGVRFGRPQPHVLHAADHAARIVAAAESRDAEQARRRAERREREEAERAEQLEARRAAERRAEQLEAEQLEPQGRRRR